MAGAAWGILWSGVVTRLEYLILKSSFPKRRNTVRQSKALPKRRSPPGA